MGIRRDLHDLGQIALVDGQPEPHHVAVKGKGAGQVLVVEECDGKDIGGGGAVGHRVYLRGGFKRLYGP